MEKGVNKTSELVVLQRWGWPPPNSSALTDNYKIRFIPTSQTGRSSTLDAIDLALLRCGATGAGQQSYTYSLHSLYTVRSCAMPLVVIVLIFAVPLLGILLAGYKEWLEFKAKHQELSPNTQEVRDKLNALHDRIEELEQERDALGKRVQNLETIVTSESWIAGHEKNADADSLNAAPGDELTLPDRASSDTETEQTAKLAQRLRGE